MSPGLVATPNAANGTRAGRYAPSPSGPLHVGNLRTALVAWVLARQSGRRFLLRIEDIDDVRSKHADQQLQELAALGIDWDEPPVYQQNRLGLYQQAIDSLQSRDLLFDCYCSRKDIREAARAPHTPVSHYPGTCLHLSEADKQGRLEKLVSQGRAPAKRLAPPTENGKPTEVTVTDLINGTYSCPIDAVVLQRGDGTFAYNLAAVVDDIDQGIDQVVRGDDLLPSSPAQAYLTELLGGTTPTYVHVPLVLGPSGQRLAKRDGAVTLEALQQEGWTMPRIRQELFTSLGVPGTDKVEQFLERFSLADLPNNPVVFTAETGFVDASELGLLES